MRINGLAEAGRNTAGRSAGKVFLRKSSTVFEYDASANKPIGRGTFMDGGHGLVGEKRGSVVEAKKVIEFTVSGREHVDEAW